MAPPMKAPSMQSAAKATFALSGVLAFITACMVRDVLSWLPGENTGIRASRRLQTIGRLQLPQDEIPSEYYFAFVDQIHCFGGLCDPIADWRRDLPHEYFPDPPPLAKATWQMDIYVHNNLPEFGGANKTPVAFTYYDSMFYNANEFAWIPIKEAPAYPPPSSFGSSGPPPFGPPSSSSAGSGSGIGGGIGGGGIGGVGGGNSAFAGPPPPPTAGAGKP